MRQVLATTPHGERATREMRSCAGVRTIHRCARRFCALHSLRSACLRPATGSLWRAPARRAAAAVCAPLLALMAVGSALCALVALVRERSALAFATAAANFALCVLASGGPLLLWLWTRGDSDRFFWVIHQGYPCSAMGGGPGGLWVLGSSWLTAIAALAYGLTSSHPLRRVAVLGVGGGARGDRPGHVP